MLTSSQSAPATDALPANVALLDTCTKFIRTFLSLTFYSSDQKNCSEQDLLVWGQEYKTVDQEHYKTSIQAYATNKI